jgi:hypothetical protein
MANRIPDVKCGPADVLASLPLGVRYEGFDLSEAYIGQARRRGRLVSTDGCYDREQSRVARYMISKDRGRNVRDETGYLSLARQVFRDVTPHVRHDLLRIPYTLLVLECRNQHD